MTIVRFLRATLLIAAAVLAAGCQAFFFRVVNTGSGSDPETRSFDEPNALRLDVYRPRDVHEPAPVVLFFYGGSWRHGARGDYAFVGRALAARGVIVVIPDYRKAPQNVFPAFEEDAAKAARWTFDHAADFGGDPHRVFVAGHSAGAHIAVLLASDGRYLAAQRLAPRDFAGAIGIAGPYDFLPLTDPDLIEVFGRESEWPASQPVNFIDGDEPPFLLLQGQGDRIVDPRNADALAAKVRAKAESVRVVRYPSIGHFRIIGAMRFASLAPTLDDVVSFVDETPAVAGPPH